MADLVAGLVAGRPVVLPVAMEPVAFSEGARALLDGANFAHLATLQPDGSPKVEPVWIGREGDLLLVATDRKSLKVRNIEGDARVAVSVSKFDDPYDQLLVRGVVSEIREDDDLTVLDDLAQTYLGEPFARRRWSGRVVLVVTPHLARHYRSALHDPRTPPREG